MTLSTEGDAPKPASAAQKKHNPMMPTLSEPVTESHLLRFCRTAKNSSSFWQMKIWCFSSILFSNLRPLQTTTACIRSTRAPANGICRKTSSTAQQPHSAAYMQQPQHNSFLNKPSNIYAEGSARPQSYVQPPAQQPQTYMQPRTLQSNQQAAKPAEEPAMQQHNLCRSPYAKATGSR